MTSSTVPPRRPSRRRKSIPRAREEEALGGHGPKRPSSDAPSEGAARQVDDTSPRQSTEHDKNLQADREMRGRFSKWPLLVIGAYVFWYVTMLLLFLFFPEIKGDGDLPLTAMIASPTLVTLAVLMPVLSGIYRRDGGTGTRVTDVFQDSAGNGP